MYTKFCLESLRGKDHSRKTRLRRVNNIKMDLREIECEMVWTGFIWLMMGIC
jgi:hypothetical protein